MGNSWPKIQASFGTLKSVFKRQLTQATINCLTAKVTTNNQRDEAIILCYFLLGGATHNSCHGRKGGTPVESRVALSVPRGQTLLEIVCLCIYPFLTHLLVVHVELRRAEAHA